MGVKQDPELRELADNCRQSVEDRNGGRYELDAVRAELRRELKRRPQLLARHQDELIALLVRESDERATQASQLSLLEDDEVEREIWALGLGQRVRAGVATLDDMRRHASERQANVDRVNAANERQQSDEAALVPFFTTPQTTVAQARSAYLSATAEAA